LVDKLANINQLCLENLSGDIEDVEILENLANSFGSSVSTLIVEFNQENEVPEENIIRYIEAFRKFEKIKTLEINISEDSSFVKQFL